MRVHEFVIHADIERSDITEISSKSSHFISDISIEFTHNQAQHVVDVKSLLGMLLVPIKAGTLIRLVTKGKDEEEAMHDMFNFFESFR
ncbi:HPr family phosphocarrier protein [Paenibacillus sedimenti]|uniref:HPr family phosphocarrier protein n=1 Tax=Paenibacillus sedimenti TaxID=2770274 RepID=A0A926QLW2_9BACL|nr:HPr family phosphocarrier protein [Paenibacillus sedimenti]MBD0383007.1 HPr family phosphocarrier protein [Paenibacillus sedimenti]